MDYSSTITLDLPCHVEREELRPIADEAGKRVRAALDTLTVG